MTLNQLTSDVYRHLPLHVRLLVSHRRVARIVRCAMMADPANYAGLADGRGILRRDAVAHYRQRVGNPLIWLWLISLIVNLIWQWWLAQWPTDGPMDRAMGVLYELHREAKGKGWTP